MYNVLCVQGKGTANTFHPNTMSFDNVKNKIKNNIEYLEKVLFCNNLGDLCADNDLSNKIN